IRRSYSSADYVRFTRQAFEAWAEVAEESGEKLVTITGGLDLFPRDPIDEPEAFLAAMREEGVQHELLDAAALVARWPAWHVSDEVVAIYQHDAGIVAASRANAVHRRLARARGADLLPETPADRITPEGAGFMLETATRTFRCGSLVMAADSWMNEVLAPFGVHLPLRILQEQVTDFDLDLVPGTSNVSFGLGTAHGFKFASAFGRTLVELALDGTSEWRLPRFAADRRSLTQPA